MAEPRFIPQPLNILGGVAQVQGIKARQAATDLAQQQFQLQQQQILADEQRRAEDRETTQSLNRFNQGTKVLDSIIKAGATDEVVNNFIRTKIAPEMDGVLDDFSFTGKGKEAGTMLMKLNTEFQKNVKAGTPRNEALQTMHDSLIALKAQFPAVEAIGEAAETVEAQQAAAAIAPLGRTPEEQSALAAGVDPADVARFTAKPTAQKFIQVQTVDAQGNEVTAFLDPVTLKTVQEVPTPVKTKEGKPQIIEVGVPNFPGFFQKAEVSGERDAEGNLVLRPVGAPFEKKAEPFALPRTDTGVIPVGIGGEVGAPAGPPTPPVTTQQITERAQPRTLPPVSEKIAPDDKQLFEAFRKETVRRHKAAGVPIPTTRIIRQEFNKRR
jgi:hypothetical protein